MIIRILEDNEKNRIRPLYEEVFDDSQYFLDYYFGSYIKKAINFVCESEGEIVGMATIHPKSLMIAGDTVRVGYVYAVATRMAYRGQGIMRKILDEIYVYAFKHNYAYLYLIPVDPKIYFRCGYELVRAKREFVEHYDAEQICVNNGLSVIKVTEDYVQKCIEFIHEFGRDGILVMYEEENLLQILERLSINNSGIYCILDSICDRIQGLAFIEDDDDRLMINELYCANDDISLCMRLVMDKLNKKDIIYKINDIMFKEVHKSMEQLKDYSIYINDEV